jgi:hypothetical protein
VLKRGVLADQNCMDVLMSSLVEPVVVLGHVEMNRTHKGRWEDQQGGGPLSSLTSPSCGHMGTSTKVIEPTNKVKFASFR